MVILWAQAAAGHGSLPSSPAMAASISSADAKDTSALRGAPRTQRRTVTTVPNFFTASRCWADLLERESEPDFYNQNPAMTRRLDDVWSTGDEVIPIWPRDSPCLSHGRSRGVKAQAAN